MANAVQRSFVEGLVSTDGALLSASLMTSYLSFGCLFINPPLSLRLSQQVGVQLPDAKGV